VRLAEAKAGVALLGAVEPVVVPVESGLAPMSITLPWSRKSDQDTVTSVEASVMSTWPSAQVPKVQWSIHMREAPP
jgi:hypothetical protein